MKRRILLPLLLLSMLTLVAFGALACNPGTKTPEPGAETGTYYCYTDSGVPETVTLFGGNKFTMSIASKFLDGTYSVKNANLTFKLNDAPEYKIDSASLANDILTVRLEQQERTIKLFKSLMRTVTFDTMGGGEVPSTLVLNGQPLSKPDDPIKSGSKFVGWFTDDEFTSPFMFNSQIVTSDMTLFAYFGDALPVDTEFTLEFNLNYPGAENTLPAIQTIGHRVYANQLPTPPQREGYTFRAWNVCLNDNPSKPSYALKEGQTIFYESAVLYALWHQDQTSISKPLSPIVSVHENMISWTPTANTSGYKIEITDPANLPAIQPTTLKSTDSQYPFQFTLNGEYRISLTAVGFVSTDLSVASVVYYKHNALNRVSLFTVVDSRFLLFNEVENADKYVITIDCGNPFHNHTIDNGKSTSYDFSAHEMQKDGIIFNVTAISNKGMLSSVSRDFVYKKNLAEITDFAVDPDTQTLSWNVIPFATSYIVSVKIGEVEEIFENILNNSISLKEYGKEKIIVSVTPKTIGFNSPTASTYTYDKQNIASPKDITFIGDVVSWTPVEGATSYTIQIGSRTIQVTNATAETNSYPLNEADLTAIAAFTGDYQITVTANGSTTSKPSDAIIVTNSVFGGVNYFAGFASWKYLKGAAKYRVTVNQGTALEQTATISDTNRAAISFNKSGENTISVMPLNANDQSLVANAVTISVFAYKVEFDPRGGDIQIDALYKAFGDPVDDFPDASNSSSAGGILEGWYKAPGGAAQNAAKYNFSSFVGGDIVLYAYWAPMTYSISLNAGSGTISTTTQDVKFGNHFTLSTPTIDGNGFIGWYTQVGGKGARLTNELGQSINAWNIEDADDLEIFAFYGDVISFAEKGAYYTASRGSEISFVSTVVIPDTYNGRMVIGIDNFSVPTIVNVTIGKNISDIPRTAFDGCGRLMNIFVNPENLAFSDSDGILCNRSKTTLIRFPSGRSVAEIPRTVTTLAIESFRNTANLTTLNIPSNVAVIDEDAFIYCINLTSIILNEGLRDVRSYAFNGCINLQSLALPKNLETIGENAFKNCTSLKTIIFKGGSTVPLKIADNLFADCFNLSSVVFEPNSMLSEISQGAFNGLSYLTEITIPSSVTKIGDRAFSKCINLSKVTVEANSMLNTIGNDVFSNTQLQEFIFEGSTKLDTIHSGVFIDSPTLTNIVLPSELRYIAENALEKNTNIVSITISASLATLSPELFTTCTKLENIYVTTDSNPNFTSVDGVLYNANRSIFVRYPLARQGELNISKLVTAIADGAFKNCVGLSKIIVAEDNEIFESHLGALINIKDNVLLFYPNNNTAEDFVVPNNIVSIAAYAFSDNVFIQNVTFEAETAIKTIGEFAFNNCVNLVTLQFPDSLENIEAFAFNGCVKLETIAVHSKAVTINAGAYAGLKALQTVFIPSSVETIGSDAFRDCTSLNEVQFAQNSKLTTIDSGAFFGTSALSTIDLPASLTKINNDAFNESGLTAITIPNKVAELGNNAFQNNKNLETIIFSGNAEPLTMGSYVFNGCTALSTVTFEDGSQVKNIGAYAFSATANPNFTSITIPGTVKTIGSYAFYEAAALNTKGTFDGLKALTLKEGLESIGAHAFERTAVAILNIPSSVRIIADYAFYLSEEPAVNGNLSVSYPSVHTLTFTDTTDNPSNLTSIGNYAFHLTSMQNTELTFPRKLETIGSFAFYKTRTTKITFPNSLITIGDYAFQDSSQLTGSIKITSGIKTIGSFAFQNAVKIIGVDFTDSSVTTIKSSAFQGCIKIAGTLNLPNTLTTIGSAAFQNCEGITTVNIPNSLITIESYVFNNCSIADLTIPASVRTIKDSAFKSTLSSVKTLTFHKDSALTSLHRGAFSTSTAGPTTINEVPSGITPSAIAAAFSHVTSFVNNNTSNATYRTIDGVLFDPSTSVLLCYPAAKAGAYIVPAGVVTIAEGAFKGAVGLTSVSFAANSYLEKIEAYAFAELMNAEGNAIERRCGITSISLPASLKTIGDFAFVGADKLTAVNIPENTTLTSIGISSFESTGLKVFTIPDSLTSIGNRAFFDCLLTSVSVTPDRADFIVENGTFIDKTHGTIISVLEGSLTGDYVIPSAVTNIDAYLFKGFNFTSVRFHANVTNIGNNAFQNCKNLKSISFDDNSKLKSIGSSAFEGCNNLRTIPLPNGLQTIGASAFAATSGNTYLATISIPDSVTSLGSRVFYMQRSLRSIIVSNDSQLKYINASAFSETAITSFNFAERLVNIGDDAFKNTSLAGDLKLPASLTSIGARTFMGCDFRTITFANNSQMHSIALEAFKGNTQTPTSTLKSINFGKNSQLKEIALEAFAYHKAITTVTLPAQLETLGRLAFDNCQALMEYKVEENSVNFYAEDGILFNKARNTIERYPTPAKAGAIYKIPSHVTVIGASAFAMNKGSSLKTVELHGNVTTIKPYAFSWYKGAVNIPYSVTVIENNAFSLAEATISIEGRTKNDVPAGWSDFWTGLNSTIIWNA